MSCLNNYKAISESEFLLNICRNYKISCIIVKNWENLIFSFITNFVLFSQQLSDNF